MLTRDVMSAIRRWVDRMEDAHPRTVNGVRIAVAIIIVIAIARAVWPE